jgi:tetratricopeptide (TPR) repeat protein
MPTASDVFGQAWKYHQAGSFSQAEQLYRQVLQTDPNNADAWCFLGAVCQAQGKITEAEANLRRAAQLMPSHPTAPNLLGIVLAQQGKLDDAASCFQDLIRYQPGDAGAHNNLGLVRLNQGRLQEAMALFQDAVKRQPNYADAYGNLGLVQNRLGRFDDAVASFQRALQLNPNLSSAREHLNRALHQKGAGYSPPGPQAAARQQVPDAVAHYQAAMADIQQGQLAQAVASFRRALQIRPDYFDAVHNLATVYFLQGQFEASVDTYQNALRLKRDHAGAHYNLGLALQQIDRNEEALGHYRQAITFQPNHLDARNNLGNLLKNQGRPEEAIACYQEVLRQKPDFAEVHANLGIALGAQHNWDAAIACYRHAISLKPTYPDVHNSLGIALMELERLEEAEASCRQSLRLNPSFAEAHNSLGNILERQGKHDEAVNCFREAIRLKPKLAEALNNMGNSLKRLGRFDEAVGCYQEAVRINPTYAEAYSNMGNVRVQQSLFDEAQKSYDQALRLDAGHIDTHFNQSLLWLQLGKWEEGWREYAWRWKTKSFPRYGFSQPLWDGSPAPVGGRTLLLIAEQGLGDAIQFVRFAPLVTRRGDRVVLQCHPPLLRLLAKMPGIDQFIPAGSPLPAFDCYAPLLSLPAIFGTTTSSVLQQEPYLDADIALVERWRGELSGVRCPVSGVQQSASDTGLRTPDSGRAFRVGIAWQGNPIFRIDKQRSIPLTRFARFAEIEGVQLISLQKGPGSEQLLSSTPDTGHRTPDTSVLDLGSRLDEESGPFMDTAAIMKNLDLVITSDTAIPHLAGALGVPVWVALPWVPDWRWLLQREDCPWYPSMRLFRQSRYGHWDDVFERIAEELRKVVAGKRRLGRP